MVHCGRLVASEGRWDPQCVFRFPRAKRSPEEGEAREGLVLPVRLETTSLVTKILWDFVFRTIHVYYVWVFSFIGETRLWDGEASPAKEGWTLKVVVDPTMVWVLHHLCERLRHKVLRRLVISKFPLMNMERRIYDLLYHPCFLTKPLVLMELVFHWYPSLTLHFFDWSSL